MSLVLRRSYLKLMNNAIPMVNSSKTLLQCSTVLSRHFSDVYERIHDYSSTTVLVENSLNVQELPVIIRKVRDITDVLEKPPEDTVSNNDNHNYQLIRNEFKECFSLREVFSFLSKCIKITPNIALGAMERIYFIENNPYIAENGPFVEHINNAKPSILDKLLKVMMTTEDTQTLINALDVDSSVLTPYKHNFCLELLLRVTDNKLSLSQLCTFINYLIKHKENKEYSEIIDKLWVGLIQREGEIDSVNIARIYEYTLFLRESKRLILNMLEKKLVELWPTVKTPEMLDILSVYVKEYIWSPHTLAVICRWIYTNIHSLNDDTLLEIINKFQKLNYSDDQLTKAVAKYLKLRIAKIESPILIVGVLNYCKQLQIRNDSILDSCSKYFIKNAHLVPHRFLKSIIYPFGYLNYDPSEEFWMKVETILNDNFEIMSVEDMIAVILSNMFVGKHPLKLINKFMNTAYQSDDNNINLKKKLNFIDTALCLQCPSYLGPLLPKVQWSDTVTQDSRIKNILEKVNDTLIKVIGNQNKMTLAFSIPHLYTDESNLIDVMLHPEGWKLKSAKNENTAILVHLPEHYCSDNVHLIGPQAMRIRHLKLLGMKVISLKYSTLLKYYTTANNEDLENYIKDTLKDVEM